MSDETFNIQKLSQVKYEKIEFSDASSVGKNKNVFITYPSESFGSDDNLIIQFAEDMKIPFDLSERESEYSKEGKKITRKNYQITLNFNMYNEKHKKFMERLEKLDKLILQQAEKNSINWFGKTISQAELKKVYSPFLIYSKDRNFASIRFRLPTQKDKFLTRVYLNREAVDLKENLIKGNYITPIARFNNIWITNQGKFGTTWDLQLAKMNQPKPVVKQELNQFAFQDDSD